MMKRALVGIIMILLGLTVTVYGLDLFTQTFPVIPATSHVLSPNCTTLVPDANQATIAPGSSGAVSFGCSGSPAFTVVNDGAAIPTFAPNPLPAPYTNVEIVNSPTAPTSGCSASAGPVLTSGTSFSFTGPNGKGNSYNYCVPYTNAGSGGLPIFTINWSQ